MSICLTENDKTAVTSSLNLANNDWATAVRQKYQNVDVAITQLQPVDIPLISRYNNIFNFLTNKLACLTSSEINNKLKEVGLTQAIIDTKKGELNTKLAELETAQARQEVTKKPEQQTSFYESVSGRLGFTKPLHTVSISILIALGIFFLFNSGLMFKEFFNPVQQYQNTSPSFGNRLDVLKDSFQQGVDRYSDTIGPFFFFLRDSRFYAVVAGFTFVSIIMGFLAYYGYLGKK
jgi:hypothetical protein